jgi:molybdenum cofactor guanylyltransferase
LDVNCIILAGGKSARLGRNKLIEKLGGRNLLERVIARLAYFNSEIIVVAAQDSTLPDLAGLSGIRIIKDIIPGKGSLGGLYSGLTASDKIYNLAAACDMPFLNLKLFEYMIGLAQDYDAVIPLVKNFKEPLHAVYSRNCLPAMQYLIEKDQLSILELFKIIKVRYLNAGEIEKFDPKHLSFFNINTEAELRAGRDMAEQEDTKSD